MTISLLRRDENTLNLGYSALKNKKSFCAVKLTFYIVGLLNLKKDALSYAYRRLLHALSSNLLGITHRQSCIYIFSLSFSVRHV